MTETTANYKDQRWGIPVVLSLLGLSVLLGTLLFVRYAQADRFLVASTRSLQEQGARLDAQGCVDATIAWWEECDVLETVCDSTVDHVMKACLSGADRTSDCAAIGASLKTTRPDHERCGSASEDEGSYGSIERKRSNACASTYRALDSWCTQLAHSAASQSAQ